MTEIRLLKFLVIGVYGIYVDGVLAEEMVTSQVPLLPGKRLTFEALDTAMQSKITPDEIQKVIDRPLF